MKIYKTSSVIAQLVRVDINNKVIKEEFKDLIKNPISIAFDNEIKKHFPKENYQFIFYVNQDEAGLRINLIIPPNFPSKYYGWMLEFIKIKIKSYGIIIENIRREPDINFGEAMVPNYNYYIKVSNSAILNLKNNYGMAIAFPDNKVFQKVELFLGFISEANEPNHIINYQKIYDRIKELKEDARGVSLELMPYLLSDSMMNCCSSSLREFIEENVETMVEYINKLESLYAARDQYGLPSLSIVYQ